MKQPNKIFILLLAIWLIALVLAAIIPILSGLGVIIAILVIAASVFIFLGRTIPASIEVSDSTSGEHPSSPLQETPTNKE